MGGPAQADATQDLYRAVHADDLGAVKASLAAGADPATRDRDGLTPAMLADELGHRAVARYLREVAPASDESAPADSVQDRGFLDRLLARVTTRRNAEPAKVSIPIAAAPDEARIEESLPDEPRIAKTAPDKAPVPEPAPAEARESAPPPDTAGAIEAAMSENAATDEAKVETPAKAENPPLDAPTAVVPRHWPHVASAAPRFSFPLPPRKPAVAAPEAVAADAPNNPFDPASAPLGSALAVIDKAPAAQASPAPMENRETVAPATMADADESAPGASSAAPTVAAPPFPSDFKAPNAFDRFLSSLFGLDGTHQPPAPEIARDGKTPEQASTTREEPNAIDRFLRRLFSLGGGEDAASAPAPAAYIEAAPPAAVQSAVAVPSSVKDSPNGIDQFLRRLFTGTLETAAPKVEPPETASTEVAAATPVAVPAVVAVAEVDPLSSALRNLFRGIAEKNVHAAAPRAEEPSPAPPIEVAEASVSVASDRTVEKSPPAPAAILTPVPAAPLSFAAPQPAVRRPPGANARAMSGAPPEAAAPTVVAENVLRPMIANPSAPSVEPAKSAVEIAARPDPADAAPPRPAPFKPTHRPPLSGVPLALGQTATIGRPWPAANLPPHSCTIKKAWNAGFCVEPVDWPAAVLPIFDVNSPLYRGAMAVTRYEDGTVRQYHTVFPAAMFGAVVGHFENNLGPATEEDMKTVAMPGQPALRNPIRRWVSVDPQTGRKTAIEVRGFDDLRNFIPDAQYGVARLYEEGSGPVFEFLGTAELLLMRIKQTSAAFPTLKNVPATR